MVRVTLQTLADQVGVSRSTASNAFSRPDQLSARLRERILAAASELGYSGPDPLARGLRAGRLGVVGVLITGSMAHALSDPYARELLVGASEGTAEVGSALLLINLPVDDDARAEALVSNAAVDGFVALALPAGHVALEVVRARGVPLVTVDSPRLPGVPFVGIDDIALGRDLAALVVDRGHRRIAVLSIPLSPDDRVGWVDAERLRTAGYPLTRDRLGGVLQELEHHGLSTAQVPVYETGRQYEDDVDLAMRELAGRPGYPTVVIALADRLALAVLAWADRTGVAVPGELSVVGVDDIAEATAAGLTTVRQPTRHKAAVAAGLLRSPGIRTTRLPHEVVVRRSLGPPRTSPTAFSQVPDEAAP